MEQTLVVRGRYAGKTFIPDGPLPEAEGAAELLITPNQPSQKGSIADSFGASPVPRSAEEILAQIRSERGEWGGR